METIKNYLDNLFANYPKTAEVENAKSELMNNMEDRYNELKSQGKSENEAIGVVISEFGNIDELMTALNITPVAKTEDAVSVSREVAEDIIRVKIRNSISVGIGVAVILLGIALMLIIGNVIPAIIGESQVSKMLDAVTLMPLFLCIAIGVALFIVSGTTAAKYEYVEKKIISLSASTKNYVQGQKENFRTSHTIMITVGVVLCILAPMTFICIHSLFGDSDAVASIACGLLLSFIAIATFLFIRAGGEMEAYNQLLQEEDYTAQKKRIKTKMEAFSSIYWSIATLYYFLWSFLTMDWHITWIVWPIAGILYGILASIISGIKKFTNDEN